MKPRSINPFHGKVTYWVLILGSGFDNVYIYIIYHKYIWYGNKIKTKWWCDLSVSRYGGM